MRQWATFGSGAVAVALFGTAALADMTAEQVWQNWQDLGTSMGQSMQAASTERANGTLTVRGVTITSAEENVTVTGMIDQIVFRERGDGTVEITMSESYPLTVVAPDEAGDPVTMAIAVTQTGMMMVASGTAAEVVYDLTADAIAVAIEELSGGTDTPDVQLNLGLGGVAGRYNVQNGQDFSTVLTAETMSLALAADELDDGTSFAFDMSLADLDISSAISEFNPARMEDMAAALRAGFGFRLDLSHGAATYAMEGSDPSSGATEIAGTVGTGSFNISMDDGGLRYATSSRDIALTVASDEMPFPPLSASMGEATVAFAMPMLAGEAPQEFSLETRLVSIVLDDMLWNMFDPANVLPRDPKTAIIALGGTVRLLGDLIDERAASGNAVPPEPVDLTLRELQLTIAGAELTGDGQLTFDNSDTVTFDGMPRPEGAVNLRLVGGNALVDRLVQLGYLPADQAMGARMMMGLFGRPGDGPDTLTTTIEVREDGGIYANGQRIQ